MLRVSSSLERQGETTKSYNKKLYNFVIKEDPEEQRSPGFSAKKSQQRHQPSGITSVRQKINTLSKININFKHEVPINP